MSVSAYSRLKDQIISSIDEMLTIEAIRGCPCEDLREKLEKNTFNLVVVGQFKRGKTSLINALLGEDILPVAVVPLTSIVTIMTYGEALRIKVYFNDGRVTEIKPESLADYVTEKGNPKNIKDVKEVVITYPSPYLKDGVRLIDTPGVGSIYQHNTDVAYQYLPKSDAAMFLLSVDQPMSKAELEFLNDVKEYSNKIFFLLNKADYLNERDLQESIEFSKGVLKEVMGADVRLFPISARHALEAKKCNSQELLQKSRLPEFSDVLNRFLMEEKGKILLLSVVNNLLRILAQARFEIELELKSLTVPLEELEKKLSVFEEKKKAVMNEKEDFDILLDGETKRLLKNILDEELDKFKKGLTVDIMTKLECYYNENRNLTLRELHKGLEGQVIREVKAAFSGWRTVMDEKLAKAFETTCKRFVQRIDDIVDELLRFSSELFQIPFDAIKAEALWTVKSGFYYKFKDEPVGLEMLAGTLTLALPRFIGEKIIMKKMREYLHQVVDVQSGRVRYDFAERLDKSKLDFRWEMLQRIEATIEGIETAIKKGMAERNKGAEEVEKRKKFLYKTIERVDSLKEKLGSIKAEAGM